MTPYTHTLFHRYRPLSGRLLLIMMSSSLLLMACSEPTTSASVPTSTMSETLNKVEQTTTGQTTQVNESTAPESVTHATNWQTLLKNVSTTVYKDANCGCCDKWVNYAKDAGMQADVQHPQNLSMFKDKYGIPQGMRSCHTTVTEDGYVFEGHIPAKFVAQFLDNLPTDAVGLAVPGMPVGSPGMEYQGKFLPYQVMQINNDGSVQVYADIEVPSQQL